MHLSDTLKRFRPVNKKLLVKVLETDAVTKGGLYIPNMAQDTPQQGKVLATNSELAANGEVVMFGKYAGLTIKLDQVEYLILGEEEILGVIGNE
jgi:chaperonin GroES